MIRYDLALLAFAVTAIAAVIADFCTHKQKRKTIAVFFVLSSMVITTSLGLMTFDNINGDDSYFHIYRILGIAEGISRGVPFTRMNFAFNSGYGYIEPIFYPRLFLWIPGILVALGMNISAAYRLFLFMINVATVAVSYKAFEKMSGNTVCALMAAAVYSMNPYRLCNMYIRASVGELLFIAFMPLVIYAVYAIFNGCTEKWFLLMIGATCILQSHMLGTLLTAIVGAAMIICYCIRNIVHRQSIGREITALLKAGFGAVCLNLFFLIRIAYYIRQDFRLFDYEPEKFYRFCRPFGDIFLKISDFDKITVYSYIGPVIAAVLVIIGIAAVTVSVKNKRAASGTLWYIGALLCMGSFMVSAPWQNMSNTAAGKFIMGNFQFSFRFIAIFILMLTVAAVMVIKQCHTKKMNILCICIILAMMAVPLHYYSISYEGEPVIEGYNGAYEQVLRCPTEYFMNGTKRSECENEDKLRTSSEKLSIVSHEYYKAGSRFVVNNESQEDTSAEIPLFYYDGYTAYSTENDMYLPVHMGTNGVVRVIIPSDVTGEILVQFKAKKIFIIADAVSSAALISAVLYYVLKRKRGFWMQMLHGSSDHQRVTGIFAADKHQLTKN